MELFSARCPNCEVSGEALEVTRISEAYVRTHTEVYLYVTAGGVSDADAGEDEIVGVLDRGDDPVFRCDDCYFETDDLDQFLPEPEELSL